MTAAELDIVSPTAAEYQLAYELLRPVPWCKSPVQHLAELVVGYREHIARRLEQLAQTMPSEQAAKVRALVLELRGEN